VVGLDKNDGTRFIKSGGFCSKTNLKSRAAQELVARDVAQQLASGEKLPIQVDVEVARQTLEAHGKYADKGMPLVPKKWASLKKIQNISQKVKKEQKLGKAAPTDARQVSELNVATTGIVDIDDEYKRLMLKHPDCSNGLELLKVLNAYELTKQLKIFESKDGNVQAFSSFNAIAGTIEMVPKTNTIHSDVQEVPAKNRSLWTVEVPYPGPAGSGEVSNNATQTDSTLSNKDAVVKGHCALLIVCKTENSDYSIPVMEKFKSILKEKFGQSSTFIEDNVKYTCSDLDKAQKKFFQSQFPHASLVVDKRHALEYCKQWRVNRTKGALLFPQG